MRASCGVVHSRYSPPYAPLESLALVRSSRVLVLFYFSKLSIYAISPIRSGREGNNWCRVQPISNLIRENCDFREVNLVFDELVSAALLGVAQTAVFALVADFVVVFVLIFVIELTVFATAVSFVYSVPVLFFLSAIEFAYRVLLAIVNRFSDLRV